MFNKNLLVMLLGLILSFKSYATTFQLVPLEKLVENSGSAAEVELKEKKSYMNNMGLIFTDYIFIVNESYNLDSADLDGEYLKISMTGGSVNGVTSFIDGAPEFAVGEKSFLLLKKIESKMYLSNFTMGKYKIEERDGKTVYVSTVFPADADLGRVPKERMIEMVKTKFKITLAPENLPEIPVITKPYVSEDDRMENRAPAQDDSDTKSSEDGLFAMWVFFGLLATSGITIWWKLGKGVRT